MLQRLPLPVGSPHPVRRPSRVAHPGRRLGRSAVTLLSLAAAAAGAVLGATPPTVTVGLDAGAYRVDDVALPARGDGVYSGPQGAVVLRGGLAAASTHLRGAPMRGSCRVAAGERSERCTFELDGRTLTAQDRLSGGGWDRRYDDGVRVRIALANGRPVPVPIALGREDR